MNKRQLLSNAGKTVREFAKSRNLKVYRNLDLADLLDRECIYHQIGECPESYDAGITVNVYPPFILAAWSIGTGEISYHYAWLIWYEFAKRYVLIITTRLLDVPNSQCGYVEQWINM